MREGFQLAKKNFSIFIVTQFFLSRHEGKLDV